MGKRILVVDDEATIIMVIESRLKANGFTVITASNGQEALNQMKKDKPDLIILDVLMPVMGGYDFFKVIKKDPLYARIPVLVLTARGAMRDTFEALAADDFMQKPFEAGELLSKINTLLTKRALVVCHDPALGDKIATALKAREYDSLIVQKIEDLEAKDKTTSFKAVVVHLARMKLSPAEVVVKVREFQNKHPRIMVYCDATVRGAEDEKAGKVDELRQSWEKVGVKLFFDPRLSEKSLQELIES